MPETLHITLAEYDYDCADGCCTNFGTVVKVNGVEMELHNQDTATIIEQILTHLGYQVQIDETYNGE